MDIGDGAHIETGCWFGGPDISIGDGCIIGRGSIFDNCAPIRLERGAMIGTRVTLITSNHEIGAAARRVGAMKAAPITVGEGAWVGTNVTLLPGVTVGAGCVVAAGAIVTADCERNGLYVGVPAKLVRMLPE
ncbi:MAG: acyltransferase [Solirubrobacteraceae bacterium]